MDAERDGGAWAAVDRGGAEEEVLGGPALTLVDLLQGAKQVGDGQGRAGEEPDGLRNARAGSARHCSML